MMLETDGGSALARAVAPWSTLYADSKAVSAAVVFFHLVPLLIAGGTALVADRATFAAARADADARRAQLAALARTHRTVIGGLALSFVSGVLLFLAEPDEFLESPAFWVKMGLVALLLVNGGVMTLTEKALARGDGHDVRLWGRLRAVAVLSYLLWILTTLAGVVLVNYA